MANDKLFETLVDIMGEIAASLHKIDKNLYEIRKYGVDVNLPDDKDRDPFYEL